MIIESTGKDLKQHIKDTDFYKFMYGNKRKLVIWGMSNMSKLTADYILEHPELDIELYALGDNDTSNCKGINY